MDVVLKYGRHSDREDTKEALTDMANAYLTMRRIATGERTMKNMISDQVLRCDPVIVNRLKAINQDVYEEYQRFSPALTVEQAIQILNDKRHKDNFIGGKLIEWFIEYHNYNMVSAKFIFNEGKPNECISDSQFFTPFEAIAIAEKLLREGK